AGRGGPVVGGGRGAAQPVAVRRGRLGGAGHEPGRGTGRGLGRGRRGGPGGGPWCGGGRRARACGASTPGGGGRAGAGRWGRGLRAWRPRTGPAVALAVALAVTLGGALLPADPAGPGASTATVAAIQGNVPHASSLAGVLRATTVTANHAAATERLARQVAAGQRPAPDLVIWPEN